MQFDGTRVPTAARLALFLDMDGTLIDIAPRPDEVRVPPDLLPALHHAQAYAEGALAIVSGRPIAELDRLLAPARLPASGTHGAEFRPHPSTPPERAACLPDRLRAAVRAAAAAMPGTLFEDKGATLAVHFRAVPEQAAALEGTLRACLAGHATLRLVTGDMVFEIKPAGFDKGAAVRRFMALPPFAGRMPIFISDHMIDAAGFDAALALGGLAYSVGARLPGTSGHFAGTADLRDWLGGLA